MAKLKKVPVPKAKKKYKKNEQNIRWWERAVDPSKGVSPYSRKSLKRPKGRTTKKMRASLGRGLGHQDIGPENL